jgi:FKBP-type peptidyl-prolyl cis-trans isomerase SlyD
MSANTVTKGKVVYITFTVLNDAGQVMGQQDVPVGYVHGAGSGLFEEVEAALEGRAEGEQIETHLSPDKAFGPRNPDLVIEDDIDNVPPQIRYLGAEAEFQNESGEVLSFRVTEIAEGRITLDANHPLAGRNATCVATVVSLRDATAEEMKTGFPADQGPHSLH